MTSIMQLAAEHNFLVIEDAAQAINSFHNGKPLGSIGHLGCFSFHETKNIISGEGGMLVLNDERFLQRAEVIWEKGTNRSAFSRGEVDKYSWIDIGSSFLPSEITAAFLWAQLQQLDDIQAKRIAIWNNYHKGLLPLQKKGHISLPVIPAYATNNAHMFYIVCSSGNDRDALIAYLGRHEIEAIFHYLPLHNSPFFNSKYEGRILSEAERFSKCVVRLPFYTELTETENQPCNKCGQSIL